MTMRRRRGKSRQTAAACIRLYAWSERLHGHGALKKKANKASLKASVGSASRGAGGGGAYLRAKATSGTHTVTRTKAAAPCSFSSGEDSKFLAAR